MRKQRKFKIEVSGVGEFPWDMLRYDRGHFPTAADERAAKAKDRGRRYVTVICEEYPTRGRWESFMWQVTKEEELRG